MAGSKVWFAADPAAATGFSSTATGESIRTRPRDFSLAGLTTLSEVIDPTTYIWRDEEWGGLPLKGQVLYELHVGTFTPEGTWDAAARAAAASRRRSASR